MLHAKIDWSWPGRVTSWALVLAVATIAEGVDSARVTSGSIGGAAPHSGKGNVAVLEFTGSFKNFAREDLAALTARFETELMNTGAYTILERRSMDAILQEQGFQQTGACNSSECQVKVGQLLGVDKIITGEVSKMGDLITLNVKMVDVEKGSNELSHALDIQGTLQDVLRGGCYEMAQIFGGKKQPAGEHSVLAVQKMTIWPWLVGGVGIVAAGVVTYIVVSQPKESKRTVSSGF